jgi:methionine synthase I (cobalamin-dependent)
MHNLLMKVLESGNPDETLNDICDIAQKAKLQPESDLLYDIIHNVIADYVDTMFTAETEAILYRTTSDHLRDKAVIVYMDAFPTKFNHRLELLDRVADEMVRYPGLSNMVCRVVI